MYKYYTTMANPLSFFTFRSFPFLKPLKIYCDLGTSTTRIAVKEKGIVLREPSYIAFNSQSNDYIFIGSEAKNILGKTPEFLKIKKPVVNGVISDFDAEVALMNRFINRSISPYLHENPLLKPTVVALTTYPSIATEIEQKAVEEVILKSTATAVQMIEKPLATAAGCGINIFSHNPQLIIDMGGGLVEISIVSGGGIVSRKTLKNAGEHMDKLIANYIYLKHGIILGEITCENLKMNCFHFQEKEIVQLVRGKSLENGLPKSIKVKSDEIKEALQSNFTQIIEATKELIELSPPEIVDDIFDQGILLTGKLAEIKGIDAFFSKELGINTSIPPHFADATINGLIALDKMPHAIERLLPLS